MKQARIIFEDGKVFNGYFFSKGNDCLAEIVFNTSMTGYQEILTDPSYCQQMIVMTYPMIGNYGINPEDVESKKIYLDALIVKEYVDTPSNWRSTKTLQTYLSENNIIGITNVDTRALTRYIRDKGSKLALITSSTESVETLIKKTNFNQNTFDQNLVEQVSAKACYKWDKPKETKFNIAVIDCGVKSSILNNLKEGGCQCDIYPNNTNSNEILSKNYDGVLISNGPGDPATVKSTIKLVKSLFNKLPVYGICLGHQIICLANNIDTYKLKFGHHGANHPIKNLLTGKIEVTSQNHGFSVEEKKIKENGFEITHINLNDNTIAGIQSKNGLIASVQYHPEAGPGPHDSKYFFHQFFKQIEKYKTKIKVS